VDLFDKRSTEYSTVTPLHNATGTPAITVPLHWTADGLPVGVHFAGRYAEEATLLRLAAQLEGAQPWFDNVPDL
jgi:amidase